MTNYKDGRMCRYWKFIEGGHYVESEGKRGFAVLNDSEMQAYIGLPENMFQSGRRRAVT